MAANVRQSEVLPDFPNHRSYKKKPGRLTIQLDEMWSFVGTKENKQWVWLAIDTDSREIVGVFVGDRSRCWCKGALAIFTSGLPSVRGLQRAIFGRLMNRCCPASGIEQLIKKREKPATLSRFNNTLRQRVGRLVRKTLSFSKKLSNHIGAIWYFVHHYNAYLRS